MMALYHSSALLEKTPRVYLCWWTEQNYKTYRKRTFEIPTLSGCKGWLCTYAEETFSGYMATWRIRPVNKQVNISIAIHFIHSFIHSFIHVYGSPYRAGKRQDEDRQTDRQKRQIEAK